MALTRKGKEILWWAQRQEWSLRIQQQTPRWGKFGYLSKKLDFWAKCAVLDSPLDTHFSALLFPKSESKVHKIKKSQFLQQKLEFLAWSQKSSISVLREFARSRTKIKGSCPSVTLLLKNGQNSGKALENDPHLGNEKKILGKPRLYWWYAPLIKVSVPKQTGPKISP